MKILIWLGCVVVYSLIVTGLSASGIMLGGIPTMFLVGCTFFVARMFCKEYDTYAKAKQSKQAPIKSVSSQQEESPPKISPAPFSKPTEANSSKSTSSTSISNPYKKAYTITLIVAACLFLGGTILSLRYYYDILELNQTIADYQENIQQLEADLQDANNDLKYKDTHIQIIRNTVKQRSIDSYNEGIYAGYVAGYNTAAKQKGKAKPSDKLDFWEGYEFTKQITALYRE